MIFCHIHSYQFFSCSIDYKKSPMLFSILIAHYNNSVYFTDAYKSILAQTYPNYEVIILDDGSREEDFLKISQLVQHDEKVKIYRNTENKGAGYTKRKCIELATGDICGFLDPDDALMPEALAEIVSLYTPDTVAIYSQIKICDEALKNGKTFPNSKQIKNGDPLFFNISFEVAHFFSFRRSAYFKTAGINPNLSSSEDQDLYLKLYEVGNFKFIKKILYLYRSHNGGLSQDETKKKTLHENWNTVIRDTLKRRKINELYGKNVSEIKNPTAYIYEKQNTIWYKIRKKLKQ
ncbi:MAG: glycosyltransferase family 2 protein [Bergeyella sp.]|nr:glycosyltransferase family 2 protein [Bergeyella sp.]